MPQPHSFRSSKIGLVAALALFCVPLSAAPHFWSKQQEPVQEQGPEAKGPLAEAMQGLKDHMRGLRKSLGNAEQQAEGVLHAKKMMDYALIAIHHCPDAPENLAAAEIVQWQVDFQRKLLSVCDHLLLIQLALAENRLEDAQQLYRTIASIKKEGHQTYDPEEDEEHEHEHDES